MSEQKCESKYVLSASNGGQTTTGDVEEGSHNIDTIQFSARTNPRDLPDILHRFQSQLKIVNLRWTLMSSLPPVIGRLKNLQNLDLSMTRLLLELPQEIGNCEMLRELDLRASGIKSLPPTIGRLKNLQTLNLNSTKKLLELPQEIGNCEMLRKLNLQASKIESLPPAIGQLKNLQTLNLYASKIESLPPAIGQLKNLQTLNLQASKIESLPPAIGQLKNLQTLNLYASKIESLPPAIGQLKNLQTLNLYAPGIKSLPPAIGQLKNLQTLDLRGSGIKSLPPAIGQLKNLQTLLLRYTRIKSLPPAIGRLKNLKTLDLDLARGLRFLPDEIGDLDNLQDLDLNCSRIPYEPLCLQRLPQPTILRLRSTKKDSDVGKWFHSSLKALLIEGWSSWSDSIGKLTGLMFLQIERIDKSTVKDPLDFVAMLTRCCPLLGWIEIESMPRFELDQDKPTQDALARNRARFRTGFTLAHSDRKEIPANLWPHLLSNPESAFCPYRNNPLHSNLFHSNSKWECIQKPEEMIYQLLVDGRGSFAGMLASRSQHQGLLKRGPGVEATTGSLHKAETNYK